MDPQETQEQARARQLREHPDVIARLESRGLLVADCPGCYEFYASAHPLDVFAPSHKASPRCASGGRPHCTCDTCF